MPLIILSGYPCSGKTRRAQQLQTYFESEPFQTMYPTKLHSIHLINDASLNISRTMYLDPNLEKKARAAMLSAVERLLSPTTLVIVDAMNYIKGVRYQLYCIARAMSTPHCVVYTAAPSKNCLEWNRSLGESSYDEEIFQNLISRFEEPNERTRWDSPLFILFFTDPEPPYSAMVEALIHRKAPPPNLSTAIKPMMPSTYVHDLDAITNTCVQVLHQLLTSHSPGQWTTVPQTHLRLQVPSFPVSLVTLKKWRKQFLLINKQCTITDPEQIQMSFLSYVHEQLK